MILARSSVVVEIELTSGIPGKNGAMIEPSNSVLQRKGISTGRLLVADCDAFNQVLVTNFSDRHQWVPRNMVLGTLEEITLAEEDTDSEEEVVALVALEATKWSREVFGKYVSKEIGLESHDKIVGKERELMQTLVQEMEDAGVIQKCNGPWSSPVVLVRKTDGAWRICVDYRKLNAVALKEVYPLLRIEETLARLEASALFSIMDLQSGYWQVPIKESDRPKPAFITADGLYQLKVMAFGLCAATWYVPKDNGPGSQWIEMTVEEHVKRLRSVFECLKEANLKDGIAPDPENICVVREFPRPPANTTNAQKIKHVKSFIGLCSYYRRFISNLKKNAKPLHDLTKQGKSFCWGEEQEESFNPFDIHPVACEYGTGTALVKKTGEGERPVAFASRLLSATERNCSITEKDCLALVWAMKKFHCYIWEMTAQKSPPMKPRGYNEIIKVERPFEEVGIDVLAPFPVTCGGIRNIIVADVVVRHGAPESIVTDCGKCFMVEFTQSIMAALAVNHRASTPYHPQSNGLVERLDHSLADMLAMYVNKAHTDWDTILPFVTFAYNSSRQESNRRTSIFLLYGDILPITRPQKGSQRPVTTEPQRGQDPIGKLRQQREEKGETTERLEAIQEEPEEEECVIPEISRPEPQEPEQNKEGEKRSKRSKKQPKRYGNPITFSPFMLLLTLLCGAMPCVASPRKRFVMSEVVFQNLGEVNFSDSEWVVVTGVSFRQVEATLGHLGQWLTEKLTQHEGGPLNEDIKIGNRIKEQLKERATGCLEELEVVKKTSGIVSTLAEQATLVNESLWKLHDHTVVLGQLEQAHQTLEKESNRAKINFVNAMNVLEHQSIVTGKVDEDFRAVHRLLEWTKMTVDDISIGLALLASGRLSPEMFPRAQLRTVLSEIRSFLASGWALIPALQRGDLWRAYQEDNVVKASTENGLKLFIHFPIVEFEDV
ncbi:Uncharacterized protein APZ42_012914 [Daphnia magna]|uniref:Integrase catalytic domain-containing protein n=1 Tax=Daphnia magna TaxID=35525 RepID=A0A162RC96_9CRUS|nr:Uncharacterized protein APZ42_012914 [Daphnia magna]